MIIDDGVCIGDVLDHHASQFPDRAALIEDQDSLTYAALARRVEVCARAMMAAGLNPGDRVAVLAPPRTGALITFLAAARLGLLWLGLNPRYRLPELEYVVSDARPSIVFGIARFEARDYSADIDALRKTGGGAVRWIGLDESGPYDSSFADWIQTGEAVDQAAYEKRLRAVRSEMPAMLVYTSGSSGKPKGVMLRQREMLRRSQTQCEQFPVHPYPIVMNPLPINHIGGMHFLSLYTFVAGGTLLLAERFRPDDFIEALQAGTINTVYLLPTMFQLLSSAPGFDARLLDDLEWFVYSGAAMPEDLVEMLFAAKCRVGLTYGMSETCGSVTYAKKSESDRDVMTHTIGRPTPDGEVRIQHPDDRTCNVGETGEIQVRMRYCMAGYLNRPDATNAAFTPDGWLKTGDTARLRADGNVEFIGRSSEMFKSGGYNVYPREVELALEAHPDVAASAVIGMPDHLYTEIGWAYVVPRSGKNISSMQLKQWCSGRLANYKIPKKFVFVADLPMLPVGKVDKTRLRRDALAASGSVSP